MSIRDRFLGFLHQESDQERTAEMVSVIPKEDNTRESSEMARDLLLLVGNAIDEWARKYDMENIPKELIFRQALGILNRWNDISTESR